MTYRLDLLKSGDAAHVHATRYGQRAQPQLLRNVKWVHAYLSINCLHAYPSNSSNAELSSRRRLW